ncbi:MAG: hypothetical protein KID00_14785 [Clostridium argentinense]|uniref:Uncharacterized protein n=1 Tax=Clostridium faecium TaxID=2762223 RepID=A0ABR8YWG5_9CLOT|nr:MULTISPECIES: hypothetical protein [Clostridium]MBD8048338.1 hypothetical protein [Clostridium faecium]MBS5825089.1 hypothetical protein [Clostridium argentinense]MDU1350933.1 hypothetical protein [Clostridium argentinense]
MTKDKFSKSFSTTLMCTIVFVVFLFLIDSYRRTEAVHEILISGAVYFGVIYIIQIVTCILEEKGAIVEPKMTDEDN